MHHLAYALCLLISFVSLSTAQLSPSFYSSSCPQAVSTISNTFLASAKKDNVVAPSTLRLILHDCFVEGCDGSILISSTSGNKAERDAPDNANLPQNSFNAIIAAKQAVEAICPGVVSCADIVALAARDSVVFLGGPSWEVPLGRLDGRVSTASSVTGRIPGANLNAQQLTENFGALGLSLEEMVILSGAHTVGFSHCSQFKNRLYSFNSTVKVDPSLDPSFAQRLENKCPASGPDNLFPFDVVSPFKFDNSYFQDLQSGQGVLFSDQVLFQDASTRPTVELLAGSQDTFFQKFADAMIKMSAIGVKSGSDGEIRLDCTKVNSGSPKVSAPPVQQTPVPSPPVQQTPQVQPPQQTPLQPPPVPVQPLPPAPVLPPPSPVPNFPPPSPPILPPPVAPVVFPPPPVFNPPSPVFNRPSPVFNPPSPVFNRPSPVLNPPSPVFNRPTPVEQPPNNDPSSGTGGGFTIPGIPGLFPPIHVPGPGFGGGPPGSSTNKDSANEGKLTGKQG
ncbi:hypothetical protein KP509_13G018000 [Ceratopteris richardii]|uniref:peroxidase n=1 Tax=Ceratopteris richardii TaxID=49495 RepID=A0A8T2TH82_CERRI|nr:hypothetical protein KP509_13G018000 [Ceratopteris richardii]